MKISKGTIVRTIMTLLVALNLILKAAGVSIINVSEGSVACMVEAVIQIGAIACSWWYNNSFTDRARKADEFFNQLKDGEEKDV